MEPAVENAKVVLDDSRKRRMRQVIMALAVIFLFALLSWSAGFRVRRASFEATSHGVDGLAAALTPTIMRPGREINTLCQQIATAGGYAQVTITDLQGKVLGSSDKTSVATTIQLPKPIPNHSTSHDGLLVRGIETAPGSENFLGVLVVKLASE